MSNDEASANSATTEVPLSTPHIVHDIKNSLSTILARAQLLFLQAEKDQVDIHAIKSTAEAIEDRVKVISTLLDSLRV